MRFACVLAAILLLAGIALTTSGNAGAKAFTCSMIGAPDPFDRIDFGLKEAEVVALGLVTSERESIDERGYASGYYESKVRLLGILKGEMAESELTIPYLGDNCPGGGSRLHPGERVLMMLRQGCYAYRFGVPEDCYWAMAGLGGKILLKPGSAVLDDIGYDPVVVGMPDHVVRDIGGRAGATDVQIEAALKAAAIPRVESSGSLALIVAAALAMTLSLLIATRVIKARRA